MESDYTSTNFIWTLRLSLAKLLVGKRSVIGNCKLVHTKVIINYTDSFIYNNEFIGGKKDFGTDVPNRKKGTTLRPVKKFQKKGSRYKVSPIKLRLSKK